MSHSRRTPPSYNSPWIVQSSFDNPWIATVRRQRRYSEQSSTENSPPKTPTLFLPPLKNTTTDNSHNNSARSANNNNNNNHNNNNNNVTNSGRKPSPPSVARAASRNSHNIRDLFIKLFQSDKKQNNDKEKNNHNSLHQSDNDCYHDNNTTNTNQDITDPSVILSYHYPNGSATQRKATPFPSPFPSFRRGSCPDITLFPLEKINELPRKQKVRRPIPSFTPVPEKKHRTINHERENNNNRNNNDSNDQRHINNESPAPHHDWDRAREFIAEDTTDDSISDAHDDSDTEENAP